VAVKAERFKARVEAFKSSLQEQWRPVIIPVLALWVLATILSCTILRPFDVSEYAFYAHAALQAPLLHRLPLEYPAPALAVFLAPFLLPFSYPWAFAVLAGIVMVLLVSSYQTTGIEGWDVAAARRLVTYLAVGAVILVTGRYDIFAAAAAFWSVRAARQNRWSAAWTWSCIGFVIKLFPAIFWPAFLIAEWRRNGRPPIKRAAWIIAALAVVAGIPALLDRSGTLNVVHYYLKRPNEMEGIPADLSYLVDPGRTRWIVSFHSVNIVNGAGHPIVLVLEFLTVIGCLWIWRVQIKKGLPIEAACLASLSLVVLGGKVLSAQYLVWLMPLWALYRIRGAWLLAALVNVVIIPYIVTNASYGFVPSHALDVSATLAFLIRDVLIVWGTWMWWRTVVVDPPPSAFTSASPL
jgi:hypothetical protein